VGPVPDPQHPLGQGLPETAQGGGHVPDLVPPIPGEPGLLPVLPQVQAGEAVQKPGHPLDGADEAPDDRRDQPAEQQNPRQGGPPDGPGQAVRLAVDVPLGHDEPHGPGGLGPPDMDGHVDLHRLLPVGGGVLLHPVGLAPADPLQGGPHDLVFLRQLRQGRPLELRIRGGDEDAPVREERGRSPLEDPDPGDQRPGLLQVQVHPDHPDDPAPLLHGNRQTGDELLVRRIPRVGVGVGLQDHLLSRVPGKEIPVPLSGSLEHLVGYVVAAADRSAGPDEGGVEPPRLPEPLPPGVFRVPAVEGVGLEDAPGREDSRRLLQDDPQHLHVGGPGSRGLPVHSPGGLGQGPGDVEGAVELRLHLGGRALGHLLDEDFRVPLHHGPGPEGDEAHDGAEDEDERDQHRRKDLALEPEPHGDSSFFPRGTIPSGSFRSRCS